MNFPELIRYFGKEEETRAIGIYAETLAGILRSAAAGLSRRNGTEVELRVDKIGALTGRLAG